MQEQVEVGFGKNFECSPGDRYKEEGEGDIEVRKDKTSSPSLFY